MVKKTGEDDLVGCFAGLIPTVFSRGEMNWKKIPMQIRVIGI